MYAYITLVHTNLSVFVLNNIQIIPKSYYMPYVVFQISVPIYLPRFMCCSLIGENIYISIPIIQTFKSSILNFCDFIGSRKMSCNTSI